MQPSFRDQIAEARRQARDAQTREDGLLQQCPALTGPPPPVIKGYELHGEIHRGAQGVVYRATNHSTGRTVAIKVMRDPQFAGRGECERFDREVQVLGQLHHSNIVTIHDTGIASGQHYFVMDHVGGQPLDTHIASAQLGVRDTIELFHKICGAVAAAHMRGIIHRDLKPGNILIDSDGEPRILDFGLAKIISPEDQSAMTETGQFLGSLPWASPEQVRGHGQHVDVRSDVYSIGVVLYQCLTGQFPYRITGPVRDVMESILHTDPERPSTVNRRIGDEVETIVLKCLAKDPARRYQGSGELGRDIERLLRGDPIEAKRDSGWYVLRKTLRRHRFMAAIITLSLLFGVVLLVGLFVANRRETRLRNEAELQARIAQAVNQFLNDDLLSAASPKEEGEDVSVREVLDIAAGEIVDRFQDDPLVEAAIRETLGNTYIELGEWRLAEPHALRALTLRRRFLPADSRELMQSMDLLGKLWRRLDRLDEAVALHAEMIDLAEVALGPDDELVLQGMNHLAISYRDQGMVEEALALNQRVMDVRLRELGHDHEDTLTSLNNHGFYLSNLKRYDEALAIYADVYKTRQRVLGSDHPDTLISMNNVAVMYDRLGRLEDAERLAVERLERVRRVMGEQHPDTFNSLVNVADIYRQQRRFEESERLRRQALEGMRAVVGPDHTMIGEILVDLGQTYFEQDRLVEAADSMAEGVEVLTVAVGRDRPHTVNALRRLAAIYVAQEEYVRAAELLAESIDILRELVGDDHPATLKTLRRHGVCLIHLGDYEQAEEQLVAAYESYLRLIPPDPAGARSIVDRAVTTFRAAGQLERAAEWKRRLLE
jgi:tetratricopeptide (TPR) repeat protein/tRNA A-37 threonylcarbamoyl transferase component Bud32